MNDIDRWQAMERIGGHPAVDFVNTVHDWRADPPPDYFENFNDFIDWAQANELLWPKSAAAFRRASASEKGKAFRQVLALRAVLHETFAALAADRPLSQDALDHLNDIIRRTVAWRRLGAGTDNGSIRSTWDFTAAPAIAALGPVAWTAAEFLEHGQLDRLKKCPGEKCGWIFIDASKNRSRTWCSMKTCGNSAKVKRFRKKKA